MIACKVAAAYRRRGWAVTASARTIRPSGDEGLLTVPGDVTEPAAAARVIDAALDRFGRIDTLVNNASAVISRPFTDYTAADFATVMGVSIAGFFWLTQRAIAEMAVRYGGHVVTVSATVAPAAASGTPSGLAALASGGIAAATRSLAVEYAARGIRVNAISAGLIQTPIAPAGGFSGPGGWLPPLGRAGQISDIVNGVLFLEFAPYITGEILRIDGGQGAEDQR
jgi:NAD(P)-dependent dehydrogenase (short-subunit alcohol dehydrogenase family)